MAKYSRWNFLDSYGHYRSDVGLGQGHGSYYFVFTSVDHRHGWWDAFTTVDIGLKV